MKHEGLRKKVQELIARGPKGYTTYDRDGAVVINSDLPALQWYLQSLDVFRYGSPEEKSILEMQLKRSVRAEDGGHLFECVQAAIGFVCRSENPPVEKGHAN